MSGRIYPTKKRLPHEYTKFLREFKEENGIYFFPRNGMLNDIIGIVVGPEDSVYTGSVMLFSFSFQNYPSNPPQVKFLSPDSSTCRIHPNLYADGKVCLNILGTWGENRWSPILTIDKILFTIQSLLDDNPISHEPGHNSESADNYRIIAKYRSFRSCVIGTMKGLKNIDDQAASTFVENCFTKNNDNYQKILKDLEPYNGQSINCFHGSECIDLNKLRCDYNRLLNEIKSK